MPIPTTTPVLTLAAHDIPAPRIHVPELELARRQIFERWRDATLPQFLLNYLFEQLPMAGPVDLTERVIEMRKQAQELPFGLGALTETAWNLSVRRRTLHNLVDPLLALEATPLYSLAGIPKVPDWTWGAYTAYLDRVEQRRLMLPPNAADTALNLAFHVCSTIMRVAPKAAEWRPKRIALKINENLNDAYVEALGGHNIVCAAIEAGVAENFVESLGSLYSGYVTQEDQVRLDHALSTGSLTPI